MEIQINDIIEQFNCAGSSDRATEKTFVIISVTKTTAKTTYHKFKRNTETQGTEERVFEFSSSWGTKSFRLQKK